MQSKWMALSVLTVVRCIDYLAYGSIFMRAMFHPKNKLDVFSSKKPVDEHWEVVGVSLADNLSSFTC
jgi:hypothetical protein